VFNAENGFFPEKNIAYDLSILEDLYVSNFNRLLRRYNSRSIAPYVRMFENLFAEIEIFPIPTGWYENEASVMFGDSWGVDVNFQGNRTHMGTAIIDRENIRGRVPIVSMTRGTVRDAGWDNQLGYFVGIVTENNTFYLYAHLDSIAQGLETGQIVSAGTHLGQMGNTGGGRGGRSFPVHLHVAIQPDVTFTRGNFWINPYPLLRFIEFPDS
jgi:murein DD-endopeptidase MepM/ murein hydrolase activator NlpD